MSLLWHISVKSIQKHFSYRAAIVAGLLTNLFFGMLRAAVLVALYGSRTVVSGISVESAITYTGITQAIIGFLSLFSWYELMQSVYSGSVAMDLVKPLNYFQFWLAQDLGRAWVQLFLRGLPIMVCYALFYNITYPTSWYQTLALLISLFLAWLISFSWRFMLNLTSFWIPNAMGILRFGFLLSMFLSGFMMPLRYLPDWFQTFCYLTPFPHMINSIVEIYIGVVTGVDIFRVIGLQMLWAFGLILFNQLILQAGIRRLVILGG